MSSDESKPLGYPKYHSTPFNHPLIRIFFGQDIKKPDDLAKRKERYPGLSETPDDVEAGKIPTLSFEHEDGVTYHLPLEETLEAMAKSTFFQKGKEFKVKDYTHEKSLVWIKEAQTAVFEKNKKISVEMTEVDEMVRRAFGRIVKSHTPEPNPDTGYLVEFIEAMKQAEKDKAKFEKMTPEQKAKKEAEWKAAEDAKAAEWDKFRKDLDEMYDYVAQRNDWKLENWRCGKVIALINPSHKDDADEEPEGFEYFMRYKALEAAKGGRVWGKSFGDEEEMKLFEDAKAKNWKMSGEEERAMIERGMGMLRLPEMGKPNVPKFESEAVKGEQAKRVKKPKEKTAGTA